MASRNHYYLSIADLGQARGDDAALSWRGGGPEGFAVALQEALRSSALFERWRATQPDPDAVDPALGDTDPQAEVLVRAADLHAEADVRTRLPMRVLRQRLDWLIGSGWQLRDVRPA